jgi:hypothetical protein
MSDMTIGAIPQPEGWPKPMTDPAAPTTPRDWTQDDSGRSNSSPLFKSLIEEVARLIRQEAHFLLQGDTESAARLIMAQLAHKHGLTPARATPAKALPIGQTTNGDIPNEQRPETLPGVAATSAEALDASHAFARCELCGAYPNDPEAREPCLGHRLRSPESDR